MKNFHKNDINNFEPRYWAQMINSLSGTKSPNLIGTASSSGQTNLSIVSSVFHLGANPPLVGFIIRPHSAQSPRHTLLNIKETGIYTINHSNNSIYKKSHQTSARYPQNKSEFEACELKPEYINDFKAPFVKESQIKMAVLLQEIVDIKQNNTHMVIGEIQHFHIPQTALSKDGYIDIEAAGSIAVTGLDSYHQLKRLSRLTYAKPNSPIQEL